MAKACPALVAHVRELVYRQRLPYPRAAAALNVTTGVVAGIAHRTPHRLRTILTATS